MIVLDYYKVELHFSSLAFFLMHCNVFEMWSLQQINCSREPVERHNLNNSNQNIPLQLEHNVIIGNLKIYKYFSFVKK